jgi:hypothetical protein
MFYTIIIIILLLFPFVYPLERDNKNALVNCVIYEGNDIKKLLDSLITIAVDSVLGLGIVIIEQ